MTSRAHDVNWLIGEFLSLAEQYEAAPERFSWPDLQTLAQQGANAYNDGSGPSFHALAIDGMSHSEFHYRFLSYSIDAGFDPFALTRPGAAPAEMPVISHADLADMANANPWSQRMRSMLIALARERFSPIVEFDQGKDADNRSALLRKAAAACPESVPADLLAILCPALPTSSPRRADHGKVNPLEGHLSHAEIGAEQRATPTGLG